MLCVVGYLFGQVVDRFAEQFFEFLPDFHTAVRSSSFQGFIMSGCFANQISCLFMG